MGVKSPGNPPLRNKALRRIRAKQMVAMRVQGIPLEQIGQHFGLKRVGVEKAMDWAEREGIIQEIEDDLLRDLVPLAVNAYRIALSGDTPDIGAAKDILQGTGVLKKAAERMAAGGPKPMDEMEIFIMRRKLAKMEGKDEGSRGIASTISGQIAQGADVLDADVITEASGPAVGQSGGPVDLPGPDESGETGETL